MCGRYALALRPSQVRRMLEDDGMPVNDAPSDDGEGSPRCSYNFAPGYDGIVYRAVTSPHRVLSKMGQDDAANLKDVGRTSDLFKLQSMKWGLVPSWTSRSLPSKSNLKTINCRADSLMKPGGLWADIKGTNRCIVIAQGFFEWLNTGSKEKLPYFTKRDDGHLMCFAGLWDCVESEGSTESHYTYTIITTDSNKQLSFLHDRMPVILEPGSSDLKVWLDPARRDWSAELQSILRPFAGKLSVYPVNKDVGKVGHDSPSFVIPRDSKGNKYNIVNMFAASSKASSSETPEGNISAHKIPETNKEDDIPSQSFNAEQTPGAKRSARMTSGDDMEPLSSKRREVEKSTTKPLQSKPRKITNFFERR